MSGKQEDVRTYFEGGLRLVVPVLGMEKAGDVTTTRPIEFVTFSAN